MHLVARRATEFGVEIDGTVRFRLDKAVERKNHIVSGIVGGLHAALEKRGDAIDLIHGEARFVDPHEVEIGERRLSFDKAIIAVGARRSTPPITGLDEIEYLNNRSALDLDRLPESLIVIGAGYVGIEFAQMYARFGTRVTLLGRNEHLAPGEDPELSDLLQTYLQDEGVDVLTAATVDAVRTDDDHQVVSATLGETPREFRAEAVLVATAPSSRAISGSVLSESL